jgi:hypothetical protein
MPREHIDFIRRISGDRPEWGKDKIAEELVAKFGIEHLPTTIRCCRIPRPNAPCGDQTWRAFIRNHCKAVWSCDLLTQHTAFLRGFYRRRAARPSLHPPAPHLTPVLRQHQCIRPAIGEPLELDHRIDLQWDPARFALGVDAQRRLPRGLDH